MIIRRETPRDRDRVHRLVADAFASPDAAAARPVEVGLTRELFACDGYLPRLSLVAELGEDLVGFVICTRGRVGETPALGLGPLAVEPARQRTGIGSALVHAVLAAADALDEPLVAILGDPAYYGRLGFVAAEDLAVEAPDARWGRYFQARALSAYTVDVKGPFRYAAPFERL